MKAIQLISRYALAITFLFSGFVKGQDPLGTMFKIEDYLIAYNMDWAMPLALALSIALCSFEFAIGFALLFNLKPVLTRWMVTLTMTFFTILTFFDAIYNPVPDCGCFGDAIVLTNWQTFYKNVVLMVFVAGLLITRKASTQAIRPCTQWLTLLAGFLGFALFSFYSYRHLPLIDFLDWKVNKNMYPTSEIQARYFVTYKNNSTGETREYESNNFPYNDSVWMSQWSFVDQRVDDPSAALRHNLQAVDSYGDDVTDVYIKNTDYQLLITLYDSKVLNNEIETRLKPIVNFFYESGREPAVITASLPEELHEIAARFDNKVTMLNADDIVLKTMVRANPGVMLMKNGVVKGKWNWRDTPDAETLIHKFPDLTTPTTGQPSN